jgi:hypothetical protein
MNVAESYWMDSVAAASYPSLAGDIEVDGAVVGGGICRLVHGLGAGPDGSVGGGAEADWVAAGITGVHHREADRPAHADLRGDRLLGGRRVGQAPRVGGPSRPNSNIGRHARASFQVDG